jgi:hypothetical protein
MYVDVMKERCFKLGMTVGLRRREKRPAVKEMQRATIATGFALRMSK